MSVAVHARKPGGEIRARGDRATNVRAWSRKRRGGLAANPVWLPARLSERWLPSPRVQQLAYRAALIAFVVIGAFFRSRRYWVDPLGLWVDEAVWGLRLFGRPLTGLEFRPIGYMALTKLIVSIHSDERSLRSLSYLAGLASLPITADLAKHLFKSRVVRVACVAVVAYNPLLIDMAREFKPYSVEFGVHLGLVWLFVRWHVARSRAWLSALLAGLVLAFPFAYNITFLLPGVFTLLGYTLLRERAYRAFAMSLLAALAALALMAGIYLSALRGTTQDRGGTEQFWGKKYDVFYLPNAQQPSHAWARAEWLALKYRDMATFPASHGTALAANDTRIVHWALALAKLGAGVWLALHGAGLAALVASRRRWLLLLCGPLLVCALFNAASLWPFGAFRTNVFLLAYLILIPMLGLDVLLTGDRALARVAGAVGAASVLLANLSSGFEPHVRKRFFSTQTEMRSLVERIAPLRAHQSEALKLRPTLVLLDSNTCTPFIFEARYNDSVQRQFGTLLNKELDVRCIPSISATQELLRRGAGRQFFIVTSSGRNTSGYARMLGEHARIDAHEEIRGVHDLFFVTAL